MTEIRDHLGIKMPTQEEMDALLEGIGTDEDWEKWCEERDQHDEPIVMPQKVIDDLLRGCGSAHILTAKEVDKLLAGPGGAKKIDLAPDDDPRLATLHGLQDLVENQKAEISHLKGLTEDQAEEIRNLRDRADFFYGRYEEIRAHAANLEAQVSELSLRPAARKPFWRKWRRGEK
jgi:hypothetical protein